MNTYVGHVGEAPEDVRHAAPCPHCHAKAGVACRGILTNAVLRIVHRDREAAAT